jgi:hypothetical protein
MITGREENTALADDFYRGPARYDAWPLLDTGSSIDSWLTNKQIELWATNPTSYIMLVNDWDFVRMYLHRCHQINIPTHLFWLSSDGSCSSVMTALGNTTMTVQFCGWDYLGGCDQSYLFDDGNVILCGEKSMLQGVCGRMTEYGLFSSCEDAQLYASVRYASSLKYGLEIGDEANFVAVYHLTLNDVI